MTKNQIKALVIVGAAPVGTLALAVAAKAADGDVFTPASATTIFNAQAVLLAPYVVLVMGATALLMISIRWFKRGARGIASGKPK